jgi:hypothetical protein
MIKIRENTFETIEVEDPLVKDSLKIYRNADFYSVIVFDPTMIGSAKHVIAQLPENKPLHIYVFSLSNDNYESDFVDLKQPIELCPIPESILAVYKRIFAKGVK